MKLNFLKYSVYVLIAILNVANSLGAMDAKEQTEGYELTRTHRVKRQRSNTVLDDAAVAQQPSSTDEIVRGTSLTRTSSGDQKANGAITRQQSLSQRSLSQQSDSQRSYNKGFDSQTLREARAQYKKTLAATESDVDTEEDGEGEEDNKARKKARTDVLRTKVHFSGHLSMRGCPNFVEAETDGTSTVEKKTTSYRYHISQKAPSYKQKKDQKNALRMKMKKKWETIPEIEKHSIFTFKFKKRINTIRIGLKNLKDAKLLAKEDDSLTEVFQSFATWQQAHLNPYQILQDLVAKLKSLGLHTQVGTAQLEEAMDQEYTRHTDALNAERIRIMAANVFPCSVAVGSEHSDRSYSAASAATNTEALSSDVESSVFDDDISSDAGSVSSDLYFGDKTDLQYFDWLIERYGQALTTFKGDLIGLKKDSI